MIKSFKELRNVKLVKPAVLAVAAAEDDVVIEAVLEAKKSGLVEPILYGDETKIKELLGDNKDIKIVPTSGPQESCRLACKAADEGKADMILKGLVETKILLKEVLNKEFDLKRSPVLSHVMVYDLKKYPKLLTNTDGGMVQSPDLAQKVEIVKNAVKVHHALGFERPKVAALCAVEKVNDKMQCTLDAKELEEMNKRGEIEGCVIQGPLAMDNAISKEAAAHKGITGEVAGDADILLVPDIEAGNILGKSMTYFADSINAGLVMGAKVPVLLVSRADTAEAKLYSILLGALISGEKVQE